MSAVEHGAVAQGVVVSFDRAKLKKLKKALAKAEAKGESQFTFEGYELLPAYAKYLVQYLEQRFKGGR